jgi:DNA-binding NarL/FixJ family response regulator
MATPTVLIADDHPLFREALRFVCARILPEAAFVEVSGHADLLAATQDDDRYALAIVDLMMPGGEDFADLRRLRKRMPATPTVVVSSRGDAATIRRAMACGVAGYVPKSLDARAMEEAIRLVLAGGAYVPPGLADADDSTGAAIDPEPLTPRQAAVLEKLSLGRSNRQIAADLGIEEITVKVHISAILRKLHVKNRLEAVVAAQSQR